MQRFRDGLVFKAHRLVYHSTLGLRVMKKKKELEPTFAILKQHEDILTETDFLNSDP